MRDVWGGFVRGTVLMMFVGLALAVVAGAQGTRFAMVSPQMSSAYALGQPTPCPTPTPDVRPMPSGPVWLIEVLADGLNPGTSCPNGATTGHIVHDGYAVQAGASRLIWRAADGSVQKNRLDCGAVWDTPTKCWSYSCWDNSKGQPNSDAGLGPHGCDGNAEHLRGVVAAWWAVEMNAP